MNSSSPWLTGYRNEIVPHFPCSELAFLLSWHWNVFQCERDYSLEAASDGLGRVQRLSLCLLLLLLHGSVLNRQHSLASGRNYALLRLLWPADIWVKGEVWLMDLLGRYDLSVLLWEMKDDEKLLGGTQNSPWNGGVGPSGASAPDLWPSSVASGELSARHIRQNVTHCGQAATLSFFSFHVTKIPCSKLKEKRLALLTIPSPSQQGCQGGRHSRLLVQTPQEREELALCSLSWLHTYSSGPQNRTRSPHHRSEDGSSQHHLIERK